MYKTICNYLLYKIFYLLRKQARLSARDFLIPTVGPKRRIPVRHTPGRFQHWGGYPFRRAVPRKTRSHDQRLY